MPNQCLSCQLSEIPRRSAWTSSTGCSVSRPIIIVMTARPRPRATPCTGGAGGSGGVVAPAGAVTGCPDAPPTIAVSPAAASCALPITVAVASAERHEAVERRHGLRAGGHVTGQHDDVRVTDVGLGQHRLERRQHVRAVLAHRQAAHRVALEPDGDRALVEPHDVAAFDLPGGLDHAHHGNIVRAELPALHGRLALAGGPPHPAEDHPARRRDRRVTNVHRVQPRARASGPLAGPFPRRRAAGRARGRPGPFDAKLGVGGPCPGAGHRSAEP